MKDESLDKIDQIINDIWEQSRITQIFGESEDSMGCDRDEVTTSKKAKQQILVLKQKWETEARIDELGRILTKKTDIIEEWLFRKIKDRIKELGDNDIEESESI